MLKWQGESLTEFVHLHLEGLLLKFFRRMRRQPRDVLPVLVDIVRGSDFRTCRGRGDKVFLKLPDHLGRLVAVHDGHRDVHEDQPVALASLKAVGGGARLVATEPILDLLYRLLTMIGLDERL